MKITRFAANRMFQTLGAMALGHLNDEALEAVMMNFNAFRKVTEEFEELKKELFKRLYGDMETMAEDEKKKLMEFFDLLAKMEGADAEKQTELDALVKANYPALYDLRTKEIKVIVSLLNKEVDIELTEVDEKEFIKGVVKGKKDAPVNEIRAIFSCMFKTEKKDKADFAELDTLID